MLKGFCFTLRSFCLKPNPGQLARTIRECNSVLILQLGSNAHGSFLLVSELDKVHRKGSIVIPKGKLGSV